MNGKTVHPKMPCYGDGRTRKRFGQTTVTVYTANFDSDSNGFVASGLWHRSIGHRSEAGRSGGCGREMGGHAFGSVPHPARGRNERTLDFRGFPLRYRFRQAKITPL